MMTDNIIWRDFNDAADPIAPGAKLDTGEIRQGLLRRLQNFLGWLLPNGKIRGHQFVVGDVTGTPGKSLVVELDGDKAGMWHDFATGEGGDVFDLWAAVHGLDTRRDFGEILQGAATWLGLEPTTMQAPAAAKRQRHYDDELGAPTDRWDYHDADGQLIACVYRYDLPDGSKEFRPWDVVTRKVRMPDPRPLYNQPGILDATHVVLVEGEKCADALISQGIPATTAMGGANAPVDKTDWSPLCRKHVLVWPDKDVAGWTYAEKASAALARAGAATVAILVPPADRDEKWDAADAVAEGLEVEEFIRTAEKIAEQRPAAGLPVFSLGQLLADDSPIPDDLIAPRVLTPGGMIVFGGAPKVGKSDFLLSMLTHMAAGESFLDLAPPRPLRVFYLQAEVQYHYLRERFRSMQLPEDIIERASDNLMITPQLRLILNDEGVPQVAAAIQKAFPDESLDVLVIDPIRNVFDGGEGGAGENDNNAMLFFLRNRVERLRDSINPSAGIILAHHTRKESKRSVTEDPFQALSGASSLRGYYTTGMLLFRPDESLTDRVLMFELRNGPAIRAKRIDKSGGRWVELDPNGERLVRQEYGAKLDAERRRKRDMILELIFDEARAGRVYTSNQFAHSFENRGGLGGSTTIAERLAVLTTKGYVKFFKNPADYGLPPLARSRYGYLCVEGMEVVTEGDVDTETGEVQRVVQHVLPTHYKCPQSGAVLPVERPDVWVEQPEEEDQ